MLILLGKNAHCTVLGKAGKNKKSHSGRMDCRNRLGGTNRGTKYSLEYLRELRVQNRGFMGQ
jgi:hypothetical protein